MTKEQNNNNNVKYFMEWHMSLCRLVGIYFRLRKFYYKTPFQNGKRLV